jgi:disulfide bond formation protein DsbB
MRKNVINRNGFWMLGITFFTLLSSYAIEYLFLLTPCPLCMMQRLCTIMLAFSCLVFFVFPRRWIGYLFFGVQAIFITLGMLTAGRQMWLQSFASGDSSLCLPGFEELVHYFSWDTILKMLFWGSNDCATVSWKLMGLPMSYWSMGYFVLMLFFIIGQVFLSFKYKVK